METERKNKIRDKVRGGATCGSVDHCNDLAYPIDRVERITLAVVLGLDLETG